MLVFMRKIWSVIETITFLRQLNSTSGFEEIHRFCRETSFFWCSSFASEKPTFFSNPHFYWHKQRRKIPNNTKHAQNNDIIISEKRAHGVFSAFKFACVSDLTRKAGVVVHCGCKSADTPCMHITFTVQIHVMGNTFAAVFGHYNGCAAESLLLPWEMYGVLWLYATVANKSL